MVAVFTRLAPVEAPVFAAPGESAFAAGGSAFATDVPDVLAPAVPARPLLVARYYVLTTASLAAGLWDWLRHGTSVGWDPAEGTR